MDIILVIYAVLVFLIGPIWIIKSVKTDSQNRIKMVMTIIIGTLLVASAIYALISVCLLYTSDAADDLIGVDLGGRRIIKKKIFSSRRRHTRCLRVSWARRCV